MEPKTTTLHPKCFKIIDICIRFVAIAFRSEKVFLKGTPMTYFCSALDSPLGRYGRNTLMHAWGNEHFIPTKFCKHPSCGSVVQAEYIYMCYHT